MAKRWHLGVTINYPDREEQIETTYDTSDNLVMHLGMMLKEQTRATSFAITIVPGKMKDNPMYDAFRQGMEDRRTSKPALANPYDRELQSGPANAWIAGWMTEDRHRKGK